MARVEIRDVTLTYGGGGGVFDVSLTVEDGEFVALLGPSGSGKTTLLRLIGGFVRPDAGFIKIGDELVAGEKRWVSPERRNLGMVFQQHAVWPHMTVVQNVEYPLKLAGIERNERGSRVKEVLELVGLGEFTSCSPETLSGGQRQRVALARALVVRPDALLLDEPFASLDAPLRDRLRIELGALAASTGITVIHVTHDRKEALALADRVIVLRGGKVEQVAAPKDLYSTPRTPFVARFVADAALVQVEVKDKRRFMLKGSSVEFEVDDVLAPQGLSQEGTLALRPQDVQLERGEGASVQAAMFMGDSLEVHLEWAGHKLRARAPAEADYAVGGQVRLAFSRAVFFPASETLDFPRFSGHTERERLIIPF
ncbi:MAG: ABC transporter ATP-binding protein [Thermoleophilia bacterium]